MSSPDLRGLARSFKPLAREFPNRLEHEVAVAPAVEEALVEQRRCRLIACIADGSSCIQGAAPRENAQAGERALFSLVEKVVAPVDRRSECLLAARQVAGARDEEGEPSIEAGEKVVCREQLYPSCGELA